MSEHNIFDNSESDRDNSHINSIDYNKYDYEWPEYSIQDFEDIFDNSYLIPNFENTQQEASISNHVLEENVSAHPVDLNSDNVALSPNMQDNTEINKELNRSVRSTFSKFSNFRKKQNVKEKERRINMGVCFQKLSDIVPTLNENKRSKDKILKDTADYIRNLVREFKKKLEVINTLNKEISEKSKFLLNNMKK
ncbi:uncharacterized protein LOC115229314 [Octopus sinensis]|uniref:Uncharacterized protein LOC115229314 n=1 Tax=Octopus sinensis TaxID=2607531 RepID=A0A6P7U016_9MOLL|nr:uncharacterized protein LOC115229314 [Octopus sinensis]